MSRPSLAGCLVLCLLTFAPAATTRAESAGPSARRSAEIKALIARKRVENARRARIYAIRNAQMERQLSEARAYEINMAQSYASYQQSLERQSMMQFAMLNRSTQCSSSQSCWTPSVSRTALGLPAYSTGPVYVNYNTVNFNTSGWASEVFHSSPAPCGGSVQGEHMALADIITHHAQTAVLNAHGHGH